MAEPNHTTLLGLPAELRPEIYTYAMSDFNFDSPRYTVPEHPLLQTCQQVRGEAMDVYNKRSTAIIDDRKIDVFLASSELQEARLRPLGGTTMYHVLSRARRKLAVAQEMLNTYGWWVEKKRCGLRKDGYDV